MLMPDRQAVLRDAVDQLLDAVGRGEVRSPSDCVRVLREMTEPRPCAGCGQPRVEPQEPCPHCDLGNVVPVTAEDLLGSVPPGDLRIHVPGLGEQSLHPRAEVLRLLEQVAAEKRRAARWKRSATDWKAQALTNAALLQALGVVDGREVTP